MTRFYIAVALLLCGTCAVAAPPPANWTDFYDTPHEIYVPRDVQKWVIRAQGCGHFAGEVGDDNEKDRAAYLKRQTDKLCPGLKRRRDALVRKYPRDPAVQAIISETWDTHGLD